jgi:hypothetical protein
VSLCRAVCLGLLVLVGCGGDPAGEDDGELPADAGVEQVDASSPVFAGDAGSTSAADSSVSKNGGDAAFVVSQPDASASCVPGVYTDADADGFPVLVRASTCPGEVAPQLDCYDSNKLAHPGQTGRFESDRGDGSFDYDCDGKETGIYTDVAACPDVSAWTCPPKPDRDPSDTCDYNAQVAPFQQANASGWTRDVPRCGVIGDFGLWAQVGQRCEVVLVLCGASGRCVSEHDAAALQLAQLVLDPRIDPGHLHALNRRVGVRELELSPVLIHFVCHRSER